MLSRLPLTNIDRYKSNTMHGSHRANELFAFDNDLYDEVNFPLVIPLVQREQQKELNQSNYNLKLDLTKE